MQMNLFDDSEEKLILYQTVDGIKNKFGKNFVTKASAMQHKEADDKKQKG